MDYDSGVGVCGVYYFGDCAYWYVTLSVRSSLTVGLLRGDVSCCVRFRVGVEFKRGSD